MEAIVNHPTELRARLYADMDPANLTPLWESLHALVPRQPRSPSVPALWRYDEVRPFLMRAGEVITAEEAIRRVLILENPGLRGQSAITQSLYAGLQLILPGEVAPSHRHTATALRFVVEGEGAFTAVNGERTTMRPGDFIITPSWTWHDHGNESDQPVVWLDALDIPTLRLLDAGFAEDYGAAQQPVLRSEGSNFARFGSNMAPMAHDAETDPHGATSPLFCYPYARSREALARLRRDAPVDPWDGVKLRYVNPATGGWPTPTLATFLQLLPAGFEGKAWRQTDGAVFSVVEGRGRAVIERDVDGQVHRSVFEFGPRDHFVVPSWHCCRLAASEDTVLFSFSDRPIHSALGVLRQERLD
ncbi:MAG: gentisate 1,2-dioxygenase [Burkholderiales bacterium]|nr:gentisate 1,2-dioxygenase [Burkholderiales bacterium]OJX07780.1 MAG: gentisate 1,2-dioxygenase [Burkholderiales bacterium 70-64]